MHIQISLGTKFRLQLTLLNLGIKLMQRLFPDKKKKKKWKLPSNSHIQINVDSKFQLQQAILVFGTNFQTEKK